MYDARSFDVAEAGPEHLHIWIRFECYVSNLCSNMFAFAITIGPYEQDGGISCLRLDVAGHNLFILHIMSTR